MKYTYKILLREEPEGGFAVFVPALEGCITYGETLPKAKANVQEAIALYIESLSAEGIAIPQNDNLLELNLQVEHA